jgi:hypothetical protein
MNPLSVALWLAAVGHVALLAVSVQIPTRLGWRTQLPAMTPMNRKLYVVAAGYIVFTYLSFGVLTAVLHDEILRGDPAAVGLSVFIGLYWLIRLILDGVWFGHAGWPAGRRYVLAHVALDALFAYLVAVYLGLAIWSTLY